MELLTLTSQQVADQLHTSRNFIYKLKKYGLLEGIQKGRETIYSTKEVSALIDNLKGLSIGDEEEIRRSAQIINERKRKNVL
jgi:hypothetical protein